MVTTNNGNTSMLDTMHDVIITYQSGDTGYKKVVAEKGKQGAQVDKGDLCQILYKLDSYHYCSMSGLVYIGAYPVTPCLHALIHLEQSSV